MMIGVVSPSSPLDFMMVPRVQALALPFGAQIFVHTAGFASSGHFAGDDKTREDAFIEMANDPALDAIWFGRGGYGSCRIAEAGIARLNAGAARKTYLGYSDAGNILAGLYKKGFADLAHGPMPSDIARPGGEEAVRRALAWLTTRDATTLAPVPADAPVVAFNMTVLSNFLGTPLEPDLSGHILMLEDVSEYIYSLDRTLFHITSSASMSRLRGIMLGRCSDILVNDRDFGANEEEITQFWCAKSGIAYLGRADIGHDIDNKVVPFGRKK